MKKKLILLGLILVFGLILGGAYTLYGTLSGEVDGNSVAVQEEAETGDTSQNAQPAPDFTVENEDGNEVTLSGMKGKPVVVNFWASWCGPCQMEMPDFQTQYEEYGDRVAFMMVNMTDGGRETRKKAEAFIDESGYTFPVYYDTAQSAALAYAVNTIPATYFIDGEGKLIAYGLGALDSGMIQQGIGMILEEDN